MVRIIYSKKTCTVMGARPRLLYSLKICERNGRSNNALLVV